MQIHVLRPTCITHFIATLIRTLTLLQSFPFSNSTYPPPLPPFNAGPSYAIPALVNCLNFRQEEGLVMGHLFFFSFSLYFRILILFLYFSLLMLFYFHSQFQTHSCELINSKDLLYYILKNTSGICSGS